MRFNHIIAAIISLVTVQNLTSCSGDSTYMPAPDINSENISFNVTCEAVKDSTQGRGVTIHPAEMNEFRVFAPLWEKTNNGFTFEGYEIDNDVVIRGADGEWTTRIPYYWPTGNRYLSFFAYHPANVTGWQIKEPHSSPRQIRFFYTPPKDTKEQSDIIFAYNNQMMNYAEQPNQRVNLTFKHILTNIRFTIEGDPTTVKHITLQNVYGCGGYHPEGGGVLFDWDYNNFDDTELAPPVDYTIEVPYDGVLGEEQTLIILPQQMRPDSQLSVTMRDGTVHTWPFAYHTFLPQAITRVRIHLPNSSISASAHFTVDDSLDQV